jgi:hypothetical protein|uniref:Uncharacterized protein n=1 Tax=Siphoviridae sp. ctM4S20 TaxID=2825458 RepID=A0A8S5P7A4_9CAUD|nr:MAG TPA: hypothetical protein [Siphoviridae sp. ctM4S20]DAP52866.1 MAG TPA: hypothetical protein [Caudoviricetes sp.]
MDENILLSMVSELNNQLSDKTLSEIAFKARFADLQEKYSQLEQETKMYRTVLASDSDLQELFEEIKNKNEVTK